MDLRAIGRAVPAIVPCWGEPVVPWELFSWCFLGASNSRPLNKPTPGKCQRRWPCRGVFTCRNEKLTLSGCLQDVPLLAGEPLSPSPAAEMPSGMAAETRGMRLLLRRCPAAPRALWHGGDPFPAAPLPMGTGATRSPRGWCHFSSFLLAAPCCGATIDYFWMS